MTGAVHNFGTHMNFRDMGTCFLLSLATPYSGGPSHHIVMGVMLYPSVCVRCTTSVFIHGFSAAYIKPTNCTLEPSNVIRWRSSCYAGVRASQRNGV